MKKYNEIFSAIHAVYRLTISTNKTKNFIYGVARIYKHYFKVNKVVIICKGLNTYPFIKFSLSDGKAVFKRGRKGILSKIERQILSEAREVILKNRLIYPFIFSDCLGAVYIRRPASLPFRELEIKMFMSISEEVSLCLKIFNLYQEQKKLIFSSIKSLTKLLDNYVPTSFIHYKKVSKLIKVLGKELKLTQQEIISLEYATMLHDAGKIEIPLDLLNKKRPLTDKEYDIIRKHPRIGVKLIKDLQELKPVIPIILYHHERYDGLGYPSHLKKEQIPLGARILSVIDAFDAMFFGRPYKKRVSLNEIIQELKRNKDTQFDPKIVDAFIKILRRRSIVRYLESIS